MRHVLEGSISFIAIQRVGFKFQIGNDQVQLSISVIIPKVRTHARLWPTISVISSTGTESDVFEGSIPFIVVKEVGHGIIGHKDVDVPIVIVVCYDNSQSFSLRIEDSGYF